MKGLVATGEYIWEAVQASEKGVSRGRLLDEGAPNLGDEGAYRVVGY